MHPGQNYSAFCLHTIWEHARVKELIGDQDKDAKYFSIVRDPVDMFVSFWDFFGYSAALKMDLDTFANKNIAADQRWGRSCQKNSCVTVTQLAVSKLTPSILNATSLVA